MEREPKRRSIVVAVVIGLALLCITIALCLFAIVSVTSNASGTASLPNGASATITGPFDCSETKNATEIKAGGHVFLFSPTTISIDGVAVRPFDATVTDVRIDAGRWSASLRIGGHEVAKPR